MPDSAFEIDPVIDLEEEEEAPVEIITDPVTGEVSIVSGEEEEVDRTFQENMAEHLGPDTLRKIGVGLLRNIAADAESRQEWLEVAARGVKELGFDRDEDSRSEPFQGASGVIAPMFAQSCVDFQASAIKSLFPPQGPVRTKIMGTITPEKEKKASNVREHMNYQLTVQVKEYRETLEQMLMLLPVHGNGFRKPYWNTLLGRWDVVNISPSDIIAPYSAKSLRTSPRTTHRIYWEEEEFEALVDEGFYLDTGATPQPDWGDDADSLREALDRIDKASPQQTGDKQYLVYECYTYLSSDDVEDAEDRRSPYVVTIDNKGSVLSIYRNWKKADDYRIGIMPIKHYRFRPWEGLFGVGLYHLIGGLSTAATGSLRALLDSAQVANGLGGVRLKGARIGGANVTLSPFEFTEVDFDGSQDADIRKVLMPYPTDGPSEVLLALHQMMVEQGHSFAAVTQKVLADANNNGPVGTTLALIEQGAQVYSAIHASLHAVLADELQEIAYLNSEFLDDEMTLEVYGGELVVQRSDYDDVVDVIPVSDPNIYSDAQRLAQNQLVLDLSTQKPGILDDTAIVKRVLETARIPSPEQLFAPEPEQAQPLDPVSEFNALIKNLPVDAFPGQDHAAHAQYLQAVAQDPQYQVAIQMIGPRMAALIAAHLGMQAIDEAKAALDEVTQQLAESPVPLDPQEVSRVVEQTMAQAAQQAATARIQQAQQAQQQGNPEADLAQAELAKAQAMMEDVKRKSVADVDAAKSEAAKLIAESEDKIRKMQMEYDTKLAAIQAENDRERARIVSQREMNRENNETKLVTAMISATK